MNDRWHFELDGRLFVLGLLSEGNQAEIHFGHAPANASANDLLSFNKCQCSSPVALFRWLVKSMAEAVELCQQEDIKDLWLQVFDEDGLAEWRKESANKLLWKLPSELHDWIENHVWIGY